MEQPASYKRHEIETRFTAHLLPHPHRFKVKVKRLKLAALLLKELFHYRGRLAVVASRPCVYGVFSGPIGGFAPRENLCVGCLRCTTQYPEMVTILKNEKRLEQGDSYFTPDQIDTVVYEAETGHVPIKGAGYRGKYGGTGWDGLWTDMSEIVRPTRDGIHGREFISTAIDIGGKPPFLKFDQAQRPVGPPPRTIPASLPFLFDTLPAINMGSRELCLILCEAARHLQSFAILPLESILKFSLTHHLQIIPLIAANQLASYSQTKPNPLLIEMAEWDPAFYQKLRALFPQSELILRTTFSDERLIACKEAGIRIFHLTANYHGRDQGEQKGRYILDLIRQAHQKFVEAKCREEVTLIGSGGMVSAEHLPKGILCGLDALALDTTLMAALQAKFDGECLSRESSHFTLPPSMTIEWGIQRLKNLAASWKGQLLEVMGAMGIREVRRLRGEMGRAMFQKDLENEAFSGIKGYEIQ
jgi:hypothetical protein